ncbi:class I SAM-dependent methyltransferase [Oceanobacillus manasiensis]|uniref:class I SAM-dependent methyltransferase n=1 Tax=Oceanobacillus manasiensis TaxID=586413 RepID=UPI0005A753D6|nr:class I SAM-dependent methyltransferase [Oceanobacillus manasiensis]
MANHFHHERNKNSYTTRVADEQWTTLIKELLNGQLIQRAADIGCGGGIYSKALCNLGVPKVVGVDYSKPMLAAASENCRNYPQIQFIHGDANALNIASNKMDLVIERALIHHLSELKSCFTEVNRVLKKGGVLIIQDRTMEDIYKIGDEEHIRGWFFTCFPQLKEIENARRFASNEVRTTIEETGFKIVEERKLLETRRVYKTKEALEEDLRQRTGRSILYELSDSQLQLLVEYISRRLPMDKEIREKDYWTVWKAVKV